MLISTRHLSSNLRNNTNLYLVGNVLYLYPSSFVLVPAKYQLDYFFLACSFALFQCFVFSNNLLNRVIGINPIKYHPRRGWQITYLKVYELTIKNVIYLYTAITGERSDLMFFRCKVDLTAYIEKHEFNFDAVLHEHITNDEVISCAFTLNLFFW